MTNSPMTTPPTEPDVNRRRLGDLDLHLFGEGTHRSLHHSFGAQPTGDGTRFAVWAPNASAVAVVGSFDQWSDAHRLTGSDAGVWSGWVEGAGIGDRYLYQVTDHEGRTVEKSDPVAAACEEAPSFSSIIADLDHDWSDGECEPQTARRPDPQAAPPRPRALRR